MQFDETAVLAELDRVSQQVEQDLLQPAPVGMDELGDGNIEKGPQVNMSFRVGLGRDGTQDGLECIL